MSAHEYNDAKLVDAVERLPRMEGDSGVFDAAERQMQRWLLAQQAREMATPASNAEASAAAIGPYLTISREAGAGGSRIAQLVGEAIRWEVLD